MNYVLTSTSGAFGMSIAAAAGKAVTFGTRTLETLKLARDYRATVRALSELSTAELHDLGLSRSNIRAIAYQAVYG